MVALECTDGFGVAQGPPPVPLDGVGLPQHFQLLGDVLVVILLLAVRGLSTNPLAGSCRGLCGTAATGKPQ